MLVNQEILEKRDEVAMKEMNVLMARLQEKIAQNQIL